MLNAQLYRANNFLQTKASLECFEKYGTKVNWKERNNKIIDLGCGEGTVTVMIKKYFPQNAIILGCDLNEDMVTLANKSYKDDNTSFMVLDIVSNMPEDMKNNFSHVFSFFAFQWIIDQKRVFNNVYKLLEQDGECFLVIVSQNSIFDVYRSLAHSDRWKSSIHDVEKFISPYHDMQDPENQIKTMMKAIGFDNIFIKHEEAFSTHDNMDDIKRTLEAINPFKIPSEKYNDFWKDYLKLWKKAEGLENSDDCFLKDIKFKTKILVVYANKPADAKN